MARSISCCSQGTIRQPGTSFTFLFTNPNQLSGTYSTILNDIFNGGTEKWVVNYNYLAGDVQLTAAPIIPLQSRSRGPSCCWAADCWAWRTAFAAAGMK